MPPAAKLEDAAELNLLLEWREPVTPAAILRAGAGSVLFHLVAVAAMISLAGIPSPAPEPEAVAVHRSVRLVAPRIMEPTQTAPNRGRVTRELDVRSAITETRRAPQFRPPAPLPGPPQPAVAPPPPAIEPPKIDVAVAPPVIPPAPNGTTLTAPVVRPKLAFESVASQTPVAPNPHPQIPPAKTSIEDAVRGAIQPGGGGGTVVGDTGNDLQTLPGINNQPPGRVGSNLQLLSDPKGVDFKPYLIQVLATVRRNWLAIIPESARMGRRGRVLIQFIVDRGGGVPKLVIAEASGTEAFDRAAVAGISASYPFPPLPPAYQGDQIRLQLAFSYNLTSR